MKELASLCSWMKVRELAAEVWRVAHCAVPVADDGLGDESGEVVVVFPADTLDCEGDVGGGHGVVTDPDLRADEIGLASQDLVAGDGFFGVGVVGGHGGEVLLGQVRRAARGERHQHQRGPCGRQCSWS